MIAVGDSIRDYTIVAQLKSGGMAKLFLARRAGAAGFSRPVAIKVIHSHLAEDEVFTDMFIDEAKLSARISHPNVVHVEELGEHEGNYFLAMEYVHGCALSQLLRELGRGKRRLTVHMAVHLACQVLDGLHAAHGTIGDDGEVLGVVHRDVSPQNVLLSYGGHVKVIDFGVAKARGRLQETTSASLKGKIRYMAPEQAYGQAVDCRSDVYAVALILWEMLTMRRAFSKKLDDLALLDQVRNPRLPAPSRFSAALPPALDEAMQKALSPTAEGRPASAYEFRKMLRRACPESREVDAASVAGLLGAVMTNTIAKQHEKLPESVSIVFRQEMARAREHADPEQAALDLTISASQVLDDALSGAEEGGSGASIARGVDISVRESMTPRQRNRGLIIGLAATLLLGAVATFVFWPSGDPNGDAATGGLPPAGSNPAGEGDPASAAAARDPLPTATPSAATDAAVDGAAEIDAEVAVVEAPVTDTPAATMTAAMRRRMNTTMRTPMTSTTSTTSTPADVTPPAMMRRRIVDDFDF